MNEGDLGLEAGSGNSTGIPLLSHRTQDIEENEWEGVLRDGQRDSPVYGRASQAPWLVMQLRFQ